MTNNQLCDILGAGGCVIAAVSLGLVFFGCIAAAWGMGTGILMSGIALFNYD